MKVIRYSMFLLLAIMVFGLTSCSAVKETSIEKNSLWTNVRSLNIANEFVSQLDINNIRDSKPVFLIGKIETAVVPEEITSGLEYDIELTLVNSGGVAFIEGKKTRDNERQNRKTMASFETEDNFYAYCKKLKVDKFVEGEIIGESTDDIVTSYIVALKVIDVKKKEISDWQNVISVEYIFDASY